MAKCHDLAFGTKALPKRAEIQNGVRVRQRENEHEGHRYNCKPREAPEIPPMHRQLSIVVIRRREKSGQPNDWKQEDSRILGFKRERGQRRRCSQISETESTTQSTDRQKGQENPTELRQIWMNRHTPPEKYHQQLKH